MNTSTSATKGSSRRGFLKASTGVAGAIAAQAALQQAVYAAGSDVIKVGLVGCGGRGTGAAGQALKADQRTVLTAAADMFEDRLTTSLEGLAQKYKEQVAVAKDHRFTGFDAYQKVIDSGVDVVVLASPPSFRPAHLKAAVAAGKHAFCEKPVAVDAPGVRSVLETVEQAKAKNLSIVSGLCWRYCNAEREFFKRIQEKAVGAITAIYASYNVNELWMKPRQPSWSDMEWQLRNWLYFTWLSGDHIVEQAVHTIDKMAWAMGDVMPISAVASGGRQVRTDPAYGHIFDHFAVVYEWKDGTRGFHYCRQQAGTSSDVSDHIIGTQGFADLKAGGSAIIKGENPWKWEGARNNMYQTEHDELFAAIRAGKPINDGVRMTNSSMMAILGRMAAYTGKVVTWEQAVNDTESLMPEKLELGSLPIPEVAIPGKPKPGIGGGSIARKATPGA